MWEFPLERFKYSCNLLISLSKPNMFNEWCNSQDSPSVKNYMYRGAFVDCVEFLYGFIPEVFREYCKRFSVPVYTKDGEYARTLDFIESVHYRKLISTNCRNFIRDLVKIRGRLIHNTLIKRELYFDMLSELVSKLEKYDLKELVSCIFDMCKRISNCNNNSNELVLMKWRINNSPSMNTFSNYAMEDSNVFTRRC